MLQQFNYIAFHIPTRTIYHRSIEFYSHEGFLEYLNKLNQTATCGPEVVWIYYSN